MSMRAPKLRAILEDLGFLIFSEEPRGLYVRLATGRQVAFFDVTEDKAFRHGWVEVKAGTGRRDCLSWSEFYAVLTTVYAPEPVTE